MRVIGTLVDVDDATRSAAALKYRSEFDTLTGIFNVQAFNAHTARRLVYFPERSWAIIRMDINRFKLINDIYGMDEGDKLLAYIAGVLRDISAPGDVFGRLGSDVFAICAAYTKRGELVERTAEITRRLAQYFLGYKVVPSFGICTVDDRKAPVSILCTGPIWR